MAEATVAFLSFRLGGPDGVSVVAETWRQAFEELGFRTRTVAGEGPVDRTVPGLAIDAATPPDATELERALDGAQLVVVENLLTIPMNLPASRVTAQVLRGRPALLHHHDPPWHRARFAHITELPVDDPAWRHVAISHLAAAELAERGFQADVVYNALDVDTPPGDGAAVRARLDADPATPAAPPPGAGDRTQGRPHRARAGRRRRRHVLAARPGRGGLRTDARAPARPGVGPRPPGAFRPRRPRRRLRRRRRRALPVDLGGLRHPAARGRGLRPPGRGGRLPGGRRAARCSGSAGSRPTTRSRCDAPWPTPAPSRPTWPTTDPSCGGGSRSIACATPSPTCWRGQDGRREPPPARPRRSRAGQAGADRPLDVAGQPRRLPAVRRGRRPVHRRPSSWASPGRSWRPSSVPSSSARCCWPRRSSSATPSRRPRRRTAPVGCSPTSVTIG